MEGACKRLCEDWENAVWTQSSDRAADRTA